MKCSKGTSHNCFPRGHFSSGRGVLRFTKIDRAFSFWLRFCAEVINGGEGHDLEFLMLKRENIHEMTPMPIRTPAHSASGKTRSPCDAARVTPMLTTVCTSHKATAMATSRDALSPEKSPEFRNPRPHSGLRGMYLRNSRSAGFKVRNSHKKSGMNVKSPDFA